MIFMIGIWVEILSWGMFGAFFDLRRKLSVHWVCNMVSLNQASEYVCSPDVSAGWVLF